MFINPVAMVVCVNCPNKQQIMLTPEQNQSPYLLSSDSIFLFLRREPRAELTSAEPSKYRDRRNKVFQLFLTTSFSFYRMRRFV
jgi:hypothetical protein